jgi:peptide/nickel transport system permease protein
MSDSMNVASTAPAMDDRGETGPTGRARALAYEVMLGSWPARICTFLLVLWILLALVGPLIEPSDPLATEVSNRLGSPSDAHWLGTDEFGRDLASRIMGGARLSLEIATMTTLACLVAGALLGVLAGFYPPLSQVLMRFNDALMTIPGLVLAIVLIGVLGQGVLTIVVALTVAYVPLFARVSFGEIRALNELEFAQSARAMGCSNFRILFRHFLPSMTPTLIVQATYVFATAIVAEASLSFLGVGVAPPAPSWGTIISVGKSYILTDPWMIWPAVVALTSLVLAVSLLGDRLTDALNPRGVGESR